MDQARTLRELMSRPPKLDLELEVERAVQPPISIVITSGKGGVGKSVLASNLAVAMAEKGLRTLLVDGDLMFPNLDLYFGLSPRLTMVEAVERRLPLDDACFPLGENLWLLPSRAAEARYLGLESDLVRRLIRFLDLAVAYDAIVIDTASGLSGRSDEFADIAREIWIVTTASAPSVADSYALAKYLWSLRSPADIRLCINGVKSEGQALELWGRFNQVTKRFLGREIRLAGWIPHDGKVDDSIEQGLPLAALKPRSAAAKAIRAIAQDLVQRHAPETRGRTRSVEAVAIG